MEVLQSVWKVVEAVAQLLVELIFFIAPWTPLLAWIGFWLFAVNWKSLYPILMKGGIIGVAFTALMTILVWTVIAEPEGGFHRLYGLAVHNVTGKTIYVTGLIVIASLCGTVQVSGCCDKWCRFGTPEPESDPHQGHAH